MSVVSIRGLKREYSQGATTVHALRGVDLDIAEGEFTALMGPSGSGKSTLLNIIGGLDAPTAGSIAFEGTDLGAVSASKRSEIRRDRLGFIFQSYNLIPVLTAAENTAFVLALRGVSKKERTQRAHEVLAQVGLQGMENRRPNQLSGGQQQRVAVARALAGNPAVILADEPTANLDSKTGEELIALMKSLNEEHGVTFVFATHDPQVMNAARRVIRLVDGSISDDERRT